MRGEREQSWRIYFSFLRSKLEGNRDTTAGLQKAITKASPKEKQNNFYPRTCKNTLKEGGLGFHCINSGII